MQDLVVLKFDSYPNAIAWLNENPGVAVKGEDVPFGFGIGKSLMSLHIIFSRCMNEGYRLKILEFFPSAKDVNDMRQEIGYPPLEHSHPMYLIHGFTRKQVIEILKSSFGATVNTSKCCAEMVDTDECFDRLKELEIRIGGPLSQQDINKIGDLYRKLYP